MGRQIAFFMDAGDEHEFCRFVLSEQGVAIFPDRVNSIPAPELSVQLPPVRGDSIERSVLLWNHSIFDGPEYVRNSAGVFCSAGSQQGGVEFTRSVQEESVIRAGRLWASVRGRFLYNLDGQVRDPDKKRAFDRWLNGLFNWIRKRYVKHSKWFYIGPGACRFQEMGGRLGQMYAEMEDPNKIERRSF